MSIKPQEPGTIIYPYKNTNGHNYTVGKPYIVTTVDDDGTFIARDPETGLEGNWIKWEDVTLTQPLGWHWLKNFLPPETVNLLELFDGIENILLKTDWKNKIIMDFPDLPEYLQKLGNRVAKEKNKNNKKNKDNLSILPFPKENKNNGKTITIKTSLQNIEQDITNVLNKMIPQMNEIKNDVEYKNIPDNNNDGENDNDNDD